jgi:hypothetical protein
MNGYRIDRIARALATTTTRRRSLLGSLGIGAATIAAAFGVQARSNVPICKAQGEACTMAIHCCDGLICATLSANPNAGFCEPGTATVVPTSTTRPTRIPNPTRPPKPTATPKATKNGVSVRLNCKGSVDRLRVENRNKKDITVQTVDALNVDAVEGTPVFARSVNIIVAAGRSRIFPFHRPPLVGDGQRRRVLVVTSVGDFIVECNDRKRKTNTGGAEPTPTATAEAADQSAEQTKAKRREKRKS